MSQHILVVEDDVMIQGFLTLVLENEGFRVTAVGNGADLFTTLETEPTDLILLDLGLPDYDGMDLLQEIRRHHAMPVIVASARRRAEDREAAMDLGANDYVTKPFEPEDLISRIRDFIGDRRAAAPQSPVAATPRASAQRVPVADPIPSGVAPGPTPGAVPHPGRADAPAYVPPPKGTGIGMSDQTVMLFGAIAIFMALGGGGYWYINYLDDKTSAAERAMQDRQSAAVGGDATATSQSPVEPASPSDSPEPSRPIPENLTESVVVDPSVSASGPALAKTSCGTIPDVVWWRIKTHDQVIQFVDQTYQGDWGPYIASWTERLEKLQDIYVRHKAIKTASGDILQDGDLARYVNQVAERLVVTRCLAEEASLTPH